MTAIIPLCKKDVYREGCEGMFYFKEDVRTAITSIEKDILKEIHELPHNSLRFRRRSIIKRCAYEKVLQLLDKYIGDKNCELRGGK